MKRIICVTAAILTLFISAGHASVINFDSYIDIQSIEGAFNVDFSPLWNIQSDGASNKVGFFIDTLQSGSIDFKDGPVFILSATVVSSGGVLSGYLYGTLVNSTPLPLFEPTTANLSDWGLLDQLVFNSYTVTLDDLVFEAEPTSIPTPIPSAFWLFGTGLISFVGVRRKFRF